LKVIKLNATESTNTYLKSLCREIEVADGLVVVTKKQTKGRGQMTNSWSSKTGQSLTFSMFKRFDNLLIQDTAVITFAVSLAIKEALQRFAIPKVTIKWPNDIMSYNKKVAGILIENQLNRDKVTSSIIGIGLNVNETEFSSLPRASSLKLITGIEYNLEELLTKVSETMLLQIKKISFKKYAALKLEYEASLYRKDAVTVFETPTGKRFNGVIKGVTTEGELCVENEAEMIEKFQLKEIKMLF